MNPTLHRRISDIVEAALELPPGERAAHLERECGNDTVLRAEVESLLRHSEKVPTNFLENAGEPTPSVSHHALSTMQTHSQASTVDFPRRSSPVDAPQAIPGYEVVKTLGKGGMGVVFLAQDLKLPRQVALKMIRSGADADERELRRFQAEAEAVARLSHPNIVHIYETGRHQEMPYFVLEYVEGGTLAGRMKQGLTPNEAAESVMILAKAMQAAHQRGIIHRDLKPANVLLTLDGSPKITDFGLAKQLSTDQALSQTGDVMGTPSYMAPEQAFGKIQEIGPATDVYALGAILYEMLTGVPPFKGANHIETLDMVRFQDPVPVRKLQPRTPRDLETICLKCLRKDPKQRYSSALALAQDLERFQAGESILARPEGMLGRFVRKVRRHRAASVLALLLTCALATTAFIYFRSDQASRVQELVNRLEQERTKGDWTDKMIRDHEALLDELAALAPERAVQARSDFHESLSASAMKRLRQRSALGPEDEREVERIISLLQPRDEEAARTVKDTFRGRQREWQTVVHLEKPTRDDLVTATLQNVKPHELDLTKVPSQGNVRLEATWENLQEQSLVGITLYADLVREQSGYTITLETPGTEKSGHPRNFHQAAQANVDLALKIYRNGTLLRQTLVPARGLTDRPLHLSLERVDDRLRVRINGGANVEVHDLFPLIPNGQCGLLWPKGVSLKNLLAVRQPPSRKAGPLELADDLFTQGKFKDALALYEQQVTEAAGTTLAWEARFKRSLTLEELKDPLAAAQGYESLVLETSKDARKWNLLASFQLLAHFLRTKQPKEADALLSRLVFHHGLEKDRNAILYIPDQVRSEILDTYRNNAGGFGHWRYNPERVEQTRLLVQLEALLEVPQIYHGWTQMSLLRVLRLEGHREEAIQRVEAWLRDIPPEDTTFGLLFTAELGWLMREKGTPARVLTEIERRLEEKPGVIRVSCAGLLVERARTHAALNEWDRAERDLETFFALVPSAKSGYRNWSDACLLLGLAREKKGDSDGAKQAWRKGKYEGDFDDPSFRGNLSGGIGVVNALLTASLCQELDGKTLEGYVRNLTKGQPAVTASLDFLGSKTLFPTAAATMNRMWLTPRGKDVMRQMALQTCSFPDYVRFPIQTFGAQMIRDEAVGDAMSPEQEDLAWNTSKDVFTAVTDGKVDLTLAGQLAYLWKRGPLPLFGTDALKSLDASLRAPAAYFLSFRFRRLGQNPEPVLRLALSSAEGNANLQRLIQEELKKK